MNSFSSAFLLQTTKSWAIYALRAELRKTVFKETPLGSSFNHECMKNSSKVMRLHGSITSIFSIIAFASKLI